MTKEMLETGEVFDWDNYSKLGDLCKVQCDDEMPLLLWVSETPDNYFLMSTSPSMGWPWKPTDYTKKKPHLIRVAREDEVFNAKNRDSVPTVWRYS